MPIKHERLGVRLTPELKDLVSRAAALQGRSITDFVEQCLRTGVAEAFETHQIVLSAQETAGMIELLLNPQEPTEALREALRFHAETVEVR